MVFSKENVAGRFEQFFFVKKRITFIMAIDTSVPEVCFSYTSAPYLHHL
jgi:hypothetical protein